MPSQTLSLSVAAAGHATLPDPVEIGSTHVYRTSTGRPNEMDLPFMVLSQKLEALKRAQTDKSTCPELKTTYHLNSMYYHSGGTLSEACTESQLTEDQGPDAIQFRGPEHVLIDYKRTMVPFLESLFPRKVVQQLVPDPSNSEEEQQEQLSAAHLQLLVYSASKNFAGFTEPPLEMT